MDLPKISEFLVGFLVRWIMKVGGGFLLAYGVSQQSVEEIVGACVAIVTGLVISLIQHKKAVLMPPPTASKAS